MTERDDGTAANPPDGHASPRQAAHERLSTGALARWARACATHPWRVVGTWVGIIVVLIVLVATVGGDLRDEFEIPGSDTQKATDLIESEFASEQGGVLNVVFAAPEGERLDTPERKAAIEKAIAQLKSPEFKPQGRQGRPRERRRSVQRGHVLQGRPDRLRRGAVRPDDRGRRPRRGRRRRGRRARRRSKPVGVTVEYNGEAEFPPIEQGTSELLGLLAAIIVLLIVFRTFVGDAHPDRARDHGAWARRSCCCSSSPG